MIIAIYKYIVNNVVSEIYFLYRNMKDMKKYTNSVIKKIEDESKLNCQYYQYKCIAIEKEFTFNNKRFVILADSDEYIAIIVNKSEHDIVSETNTCQLLYFPNFCKVGQMINVDKSKVYYAVHYDNCSMSSLLTSFLYN
jgi:hypothetical protein